MQSIQSSNIKAIGWDADTLAIDFHNGRRYKYTGVPKAVFDGMLAAESVGKYFHAEVKSRFPYSQEEAVEMQNN
jgi:hypothetical protein